MVRTSVPMTMTAILPVAAAETTVNVEAIGAAVVETDPSAHIDVDRSALLAASRVQARGGVGRRDRADSTGAVVEGDANGGFHPSATTRRSAS